MANIDKIAANGTDYNITDTTSGYQPLLVSGTNIKTINNESILGSGNISVSGGGGSSALVCTLTGSQSQFYLDQTFSDIASAISDGRLVYVSVDPDCEITGDSRYTGIPNIIPLIYYDGSADLYFYSLFDVDGNTYKLGIEVDDTDMVDVSFTEATNFHSLWVNSSPSSSFAGQTKSNLNFSGYSYFLVKFRYYYTTDGNYIWAVANLGDQAVVFAPFHRNYKRTVTINSTSVTFSDCVYFGTYANNTETTSNNNLIPQAIYGVY